MHGHSRVLFATQRSIALSMSAPCLSRSIWHLVRSRSSNMLKRRSPMASAASSMANGEETSVTRFGGSLTMSFSFVTYMQWSTDSSARSDESEGISMPELMKPRFWLRLCSAVSSVVAFACRS